MFSWDRCKYFEQCLNQNEWGNIPVFNKKFDRLSKVKNEKIIGWQLQSRVECSNSERQHDVDKNINNDRLDDLEDDDLWWWRRWRWWWWQGCPPYPRSALAHWYHLPHAPTSALEEECTCPSISATSIWKESVLYVCTCLKKRILVTESVQLISRRNVY